MPDDDQVRRVLDAHAAQIGALPHVVGLGIAGTGVDAAIAVYVDAIAMRSPVPPSLATIVDGERVEVPTRIVAVGAIGP